MAAMLDESTNHTTTRLLLFGQDDQWDTHFHEYKKSD